MTNSDDNVIKSQKSKHRSLGKCKEWEKDRRNKFNQALSELWDKIQAVNKENNVDLGVTQCSKQEIVERATIIISKFIQEKSDLKSSILSYQVKLEAIEKKELDKKSEFTQTDTIKLQRKCKGSRNAILTITKDKRIRCVPKAAPVSKCTDKLMRITSSNVTISSTSVAVEPVESSQSKNTTLSQASSPSKIQNVKTQPTPNYTKILPLTTINNSQKAQENTFVVLPAAPYIIPQRQFLFPAPTPTFVLIGPNVQSINKQNIQTLKRTNNDSTKTTMVNILPISAYSRPLSANKPKKIKNTVGKKKIKTKSVQNCKKENLNNLSEPKKTYQDSDNSELPALTPDTTEKQAEGKDKKAESPKISTEIIEQKSIKETSNNNVEIMLPKSPPIIENSIEFTKENELSAINNTNDEKKQNSLSKDLKSYTETLNKPEAKLSNNKEDPKANELIPITNEKTINEKPVIDIEKHDKLPSILENTLCLNTVEGGNARLELAEELLAASPTAAFLMSFPLVSGNRADSPADEIQPLVASGNVKDCDNKKTDKVGVYSEKSNDNKIKPPKKSITFSNTSSDKDIFQHKPVIIANNTKSQIKPPTTSKHSSESSLFNLQIPSVISSSCTFGDPLFTPDFDCNISKSLPNQTSSYTPNTSIFCKSDTMTPVKNSIYSTSNITSGHDFNSLNLYPCAIDKFGSKSKDLANIEENIMKIGSSRLTYDIDLGWSHKGLDFIGSSANTVNMSKENLLTTVPCSYSATYNPFNPEFHIPLVPNTAKKDQVRSNTYSDNISNLYSQPSGLWSEDVPFYSTTNPTLPKAGITKIYAGPSNLNQTLMETNKQNNSKLSTNKLPYHNVATHTIKALNMEGVHPIPEKCNKKTPANKMHINWMTSEVRPVQTSSNNIGTHNDPHRDQFKTSYNQLDQNYKKTSSIENNYFPINVQHFTPQSFPEDYQSWTPTKTHGPTEISIEPPPLNLPTLVGDLALGPHERKKQTEINRLSSQMEQNCNSFFSVSQLMNPTATDSMTSTRISSSNNINSLKSSSLTKQTVTEYENKSSLTNFNNHLTNPCYPFNDPRILNSYDAVSSFPQTKNKLLKGSDKSIKSQKNNYSAEALIRAPTTNPKCLESKYMLPAQKFGNYNSQQDANVAQVSHFPSVIDYTENNYGGHGQQFSGTTLYNTTNNAVSTSFYNNFMPASSNLMAGSYTGHSIAGDMVEFNQANECNYQQEKYEEFKMKNSIPAEKTTSHHHKSTKREPSKHKLECSKKESSKRYQSKKAKLANESDNSWVDPSLLWQNKMLNKRQSNTIADDVYPNYMGNQQTSQYQPDIFNSHLMPGNVQSVSHVDRSLTSLPPYKTNFNLSTIFPEIAMKVQS